MLKNLIINNIALIDRLDIDFQTGLSVLSGETGSGKSIIIDSLAFVLGERADKALIKYGEESAEVTALFEVETDCPVLAKLTEYGYGDDAEILLSRKMSVSGKNEIRINGKTATLSMLKDICSELADIFGQGQHLSLLDERNQLSVLDAFCDFRGADTQLRSVWYPKLSEVNRQLKSFGGSETERERLLDILKFQIDELKAADLDEKEENELIATHKRLVNAEKIASAVNVAADSLGSDLGAINRLSDAVSSLRQISGMEDSAAALADRLQTARIEIEDVSASLDSLLEAVDFSPSEADRMEARLEKIRQLKRKYGGSVAEALELDRKSVV